MASGFRGLGSRGSGFRVWGLGFRGLGFRVWGLGFRDLGFRDVGFRGFGLAVYMASVKMPEPHATFIVSGMFQGRRQSVTEGPQQRKAVQF